jgi:hypothetical protein
VVEAEYITIRSIDAFRLRDYTIETLTDAIDKLLRARVEVGQPLYHEIWYQEYPDIIRRMISAVIVGDPDHEFSTVESSTTAHKPFVMDLIGWLAENRQPTLADWLHLSIAAGLLGLDQKTAQSATSEIHQSGVISLPERGMSSGRLVEQAQCREA